MEDQGSVLVRKAHFKNATYFVISIVYSQNGYQHLHHVRMQLSEDGLLAVNQEAILGDQSASMADLERERDEAIDKELVRAIIEFNGLEAGAVPPDLQIIDADMSIFESINWEKNDMAYWELKKLPDPFFKTIFGARIN